MHTKRLFGVSHVIDSFFCHGVEMESEGNGATVVEMDIRNEGSFPNPLAEAIRNPFYLSHIVSFIDVGLLRTHHG